MGKRDSRQQAGVQEVQALRGELQAQQRANQGLQRANQGLQKQLTAEIQVARRAAEEVLKARAEREEYRRVLAAAIANEKLALTAAQESRAAVAVSEEQLRAALLERGTAQGRAAELELRRAETDERHAAALRSAEERQAALADQHGRRVESEVLARGEAEGRVRELLGRIPPEVPPSMRARRKRARVSLVAAGTASVLALIILPALFIAVLSGERAEYLELATGLGAWALFGIFVSLMAIALGLYSWAVRDLRGTDRASFQATLDAALAAARARGAGGDERPGGTMSSEAVGHV